MGRAIMSVCANALVGCEAGADQYIKPVETMMNYHAIIDGMLASYSDGELGYLEIIIWTKTYAYLEAVV